MSKKEDEAFQEWKREIEAKLSNDTAREAFQALSADEGAAKEIFRGGLREADYYRKLNQFNAERSEQEKEAAKVAADRAKLQSWFEEEAPKNQRLIEEKRALVAKVAAATTTLRELGLSDEAEALANGFHVDSSTAGKGGNNLDISELVDAKTKDLERKVAAIDRALPQLLAQYGSVINQAARGDWDIDPEQVLQYSIQNGVDPKTAFMHLTSEEREARATKTLEEKLAKAREEGRREALTTNGSPDGMFRASGPTIVDTLRKAGVSEHRSRVDAAVAAFTEGAGGSTY